MPKVTDEHKEQREKQVILAAMAVLKRKGYEKTTLKDIVEEAGMSRGWIYLYFPDKIEIFLALLKYLDEQMLEQLTKLKEQSKTVWDTLHAMVMEYEQILERVEGSIYPAIYEFCISGWREPKIREFFRQRFQYTSGIFADLIESGVQSGEFRRDASAAEVSKVLVTNLDGILMHSIAFGSEEMEATRQLQYLIHRLEDLLKV